MLVVVNVVVVSVVVVNVVVVSVVVVNMVMVSQTDHLFLLWIFLGDVFWECLVAGDNCHGDVV